MAPSRREAFDARIETLLALREQPHAPQTVVALRTALQDKSNYYVSKAAVLAGELGLHALSADLIGSFDRFMVDAAKSDPKCWAKTAIAQALSDLGHRDAAVYLRGMAHSQPEPVWGGQEDSAAALRGICAVALAQSEMDDIEILQRLVDLFADRYKTVRVNTVRAISQLNRPEAQLLLRLKAIDGDADGEVLAECFLALLDMSPRQSLEFVARFLHQRDKRYEAALALGECKDEAAVSVLCEAWRGSYDGELRGVIVEALGLSRHQQAAQFLLTVVEQAQGAEAAAAINALARSRFAAGCREQVAALVKKRNIVALKRAFAQAFPDM